MSVAEAGTATREVPEMNGAPPRLRDTLRAPAHPGIKVGRWTLRWDRDVWTVGRWVQNKSRLRWRDPSWHGRLDQGLVKLLERNVQGDVEELREAVERVEATYQAIMREISRTLESVT